MKHLAIIAVLLSEILSNLSAEFPVGHWSNKKEGFKVMGFGLRSNGVGFFSSGVSTTVVRWHKEGESIKIQIASPPKNPTVVFKPTTDPKIGELQFSGKKSQKFYLVSEKEPEDIEALAKIRSRADVDKRAANIIKKEHDVEGFDKLKAEVEKFAEVTEGMGSCGIKAVGLPTSIQLSRTNKRISISVNLESSRSKEQGINFKYRYTRKKPISELPTTIYVSRAKQEELKKWAEKNGLNHEFAFYTANGTWGVVGHFSFFAAYVDEDPQKVSQVVKHILDNVFAKQVSSFVVIHVTQN